MVVTHVFAVAGAKGGVGKTTTAINVGTAFATRGWSVLVVETDLAMANVVDFLDIDADPDSDPTLHDVLRGDAAVRDAIYEAPGGIRVLPSGVDLAGFAAADVRRLAAAIETAQSAYEIVLLDTGAGLSQETLYPLAIADETVLVSTPRVASVRDTKKTRELVERVGGEVSGVVFTKSGRGGAPPVARIADFLDVDLLGHVPEDEAVPTSQDAGRPAVSHAQGSAAAEAYGRIADHLEETLAADDESRPASHDDAQGGSIDASADSPLVEAGEESGVAEAIESSGIGPSSPEPLGSGDEWSLDEVAATDGAGVSNPGEQSVEEFWGPTRGGSDGSGWDGDALVAIDGEQAETTGDESRERTGDESSSPSVDESAIDPEEADGDTADPPSGMPTPPSRDAPIGDDTTDEREDDPTEHPDVEGTDGSPETGTEVEDPESGTRDPASEERGGGTDRSMGARLRTFLRDTFSLGGR